MARFACRRESGSHMIGILSRFVICPVTVITVPRSALIHAVLMARRAGLRRMDANAREELIVIERPLIERAVRRLMARLARRRESSRNVIGIPGRFIIGPVATVAVPRRTRIDVVLMAGRARLRGMDSHSNKELIVVDRPLAERTVGRTMAELASRRKACCSVVGISGF
jgi:hypothetical protein